MWLLIIMLLTPVPGLGQITVLSAFPTWKGCQDERNRVGFDMAASYPYERTFIIDCIKDVAVSEKLKT
jgi:hypothetical protein